ncbi:hypothetical protein [Carboxylicivirga marina]|uniref:Lipocalin-like domain-containing protein n=1 Tax=Carboxylicivirga marina TaxID=2800988 RepID=A0ABS1HGA6_9BACT|nr:hypothetical protein [Carboxylicivirga marina]MBK3516328.1 hypothetical protein [Carboxylicivirga marina]
MKKNRILMVFTILLFFVAACNKDDDPSFDIIPDDLVGAWTNYVSEDGVENRFIFEKNNERSGNLEYYWNYRDSEAESYITLLAAKATFVVKDNMIIPTVKQWGSQLIEFDEEQLLDEIRWYTINEEEWEWFEIEDDFTITFELINDQLIIKEDMNDDGDYNDEDEIAIYVRES